MVIGPCLTCGEHAELRPGRELSINEVYCETCSILERQPAIGVKLERELALADLEGRGVTDLSAYKRRNHA